MISGSVTSRNICLSTSIGNWNETRDCFLNNWLYITSYNWSIFGALGKESPNIAVLIFLSGNLSISPVANNLAIRPAIYLKKEYIITRGMELRITLIC